MNPTPGFVLTSLTIGVLALLWALAELVLCMFYSWQLRITARTGRPSHHASRCMALARAGSFAAKAQSKVLPANYNPESDFRQISSDFNNRLSRPRAIAGLLIIIGLLITLTNLRRAVTEMRNALEPSASNAVTNSDTSNAFESKVRTGIQGIATSAETAFGYSAAAIFSAAILLGLCIVTQRFVSGNVSAFASWTYQKLDSLTIPAGEQDVVAKLAAAAGVLEKVATNFDQTNRGLQDLASFGNNLDDAAEEIKNAVAILPTRIEESMATISDDVARGIRSSMEHQAEYLRSLVAIYSEHAIVLSTIVEFMSQLTSNHKLATDALNNLGRVPAELTAVSTAVGGLTGASTSLRGTVQDLELKVRALPGEELKKTAADLGEASTELLALEKMFVAVLEKALADIKDRVETAMTRGDHKVSAAVDTLSRTLSDLVERKLAEIKERVPISVKEGDGIPAVVTDNGSGVSSDLRPLADQGRVIHEESLSPRIEGLMDMGRELRDQLTRLRSDVTALSHEESDARVLELEQRVNQLTNQIASLPWFRLARLVSRSRNLIRKGHHA